MITWFECFNGMPVYCFVMAETTKSTKNIWEPIIANIIILGFLIADTSSKQHKIYKFHKICHIFTMN